MQSVPGQIKVRGRRLTWGRQVSDLAIVRSLSYSPKCCDDPESLGGRFSPRSRTIGFEVPQEVVEDENDDDSGYSGSSTSSVVDGFHTVRFQEPLPSRMEASLDPFFAERERCSFDDDEDYFVARKRTLRYRRTESEEQVPQIHSAPLSSGLEDRPSSDNGEDNDASFYTFTRPLSSDDLAGFGLSREATTPTMTPAVSKCEQSDLARDDEWVVLDSVMARPEIVRRSKSFTCSQVAKKHSIMPPRKRKSCHGGKDWDVQDNQDL